MRICSVIDCGRPAAGKRYMCEAHYYRTRRYGDPGSPHVGPRPLAERFAERFTPQATGCWEWTAAKSADGYGQIRAEGNGPVLYAHRVSYEIHVGPIPEGLAIDHLCRNRSCVNPDHLEPVTQDENNKRSGAVRTARKSVHA